MSFITVSKKIGDEVVTIETGKMAKQADGAVVVKYGGNAVLVTACMSDDPLENAGFFPLTVIYNEKYYAAGKIPGGYLKRESRPSDGATLTARMIDRPIRPLFPKGFYHEIQIMATTLAADQKYTLGTFGMIGASASLAISRIPFAGPIGGVRVVYIDGGYKVNPTIEEIKNSEIDIMVAGTREGITMVEGGAFEASEELMLGALDAAYKYILEVIDLIDELVAKANPEKFDFQPAEALLSDELKKKIYDFAYPKLKEASVDADKHRRSTNIKNIRKETAELLEITKEDDFYGEFKEYYEEIEVDIVRSQIIEEGKRPDGRASADIRDISVEVDLYNQLHGSALFTRGQTQSLGVVTLGSSRDVQYIDGIESKESQTSRFMLHYNFPPFSVGEVRRIGAPGRREIGHGYLAKRAIEGVLPTQEQFPYTLRVVSEVLESNGSSSMASVCSASLSLMAAGVPLKGAVSGIAMGLIWDKEKGKHVVLSDIQGLEDHFGDMDFKVAGTQKGITAFQMDVKTIGISKEIMKEALMQAQGGRMHILDKMNEVITESRSEVAECAPKVRITHVPENSIGAVIGGGGKTIKKIMAMTETEIAIEDDGSVMISSINGEGLEKALFIVDHIGNGFSRGEEIDGEVVRIEDYGAFVELVPGESGLLHRSKLSSKAPVKDQFKVGDIVRVKYEGRDERKRITISQV